MQDHQERVVAERVELAERVLKLDTFLFGAQFKVIDHEEQVRLIRQHRFMTQYLNVLDERIAKF